MQLYINSGPSPSKDVKYLVNYPNDIITLCYKIFNKNISGSFDNVFHLDLSCGVTTVFSQFFCILYLAISDQKMLGSNRYCIYKVPASVKVQQQLYK